MARYARSLQPVLVLIASVAVLTFPRLSHTQVTVTGRVVAGETGRSLEGATVILERRNGEGGEVERAQTNDKGRFEWEGVAAGEYTVRIEAEGYLERTREVTVAGEDVHLALSVIGTPDLEVRILRPDGEPLSKVDVRLTAEVQPPGSSSSHAESYRARTDGEGRFKIRVRRFGQWRLVARVPGVGYATPVRFQARPGEQPAEVTLELKSGASISGRVVLKGTDEPVDGARVFPMSVLDRGVLDAGAPTQAAPDGTFTLTDLPAGEYQLWASARGYRPTPKRVTVGEEEHVADIVLEVALGLSVSVQVLAPDGKTPAANARVGLWRNRLNEADDEGRYTLTDLHPGANRVTAVAEGFAPVTQTFEVAEGEEAPEVKVVLAGRGGTVTGRVVDADADRPLAGEVVAALPPDEHDPEGVPHEVELQGETFDAVGLSRHSPFRTETDADGRYELAHIPAGTYVIAVIRPRGLNFWKTDVEVREGETTPGIDLEVRRKAPGVLNVRVLSPDGKPLANTRVRRSVEYPNGSSSGGMETDRDGCFHVRLRNPGQYAIQVTLDGYMPAIGQLQVDDVKGSPELTVALEAIPPGGPPAGSVAGQVLMPDGTTPAAGMWVAPFTKDAFFPEANATYSTGGATYRLSTARSVETDKDGAFAIGNLPPGSYGVLASSHRLGGPPSPAPRGLAYTLPTWTDPVEVKDGEQTTGARIVLGAGGSIAVTVTDAQTDEPIAKALVMCSAGGHGERPLFWTSMPHVETGATGQARLDGLAPGTYSVTVHARGHKRSNLLNVVVEAGQETKAEVALQPGAD